MDFLYLSPERYGAEGNMLDAGPVAEIAAAFEAAGFDGIAFTDTRHRPQPGSTPAATRRSIRSSRWARRPRSRRASGCSRTCAWFVLGVGTGYLKSEFHALGVDFDERNARFDEALDVLPKHWSGEPFSHQGRHFSARDVIARPSPARPIPIWIGGNSGLTLRRVAARAQGWIPAIVPPGTETTIRSPNLATVDELAVKIGSLRELAGERADQLEIVPPYTDPSIIKATDDVERHTEAFRALEAAGATGIIISGTQMESPTQTLEFLDTFGATYLR